VSQHHVFNLPHQARAETDIDVPIEEVFSYVTEPTNLGHWFQGVSDVRDVSGPPGVGQRFTWTAHFLGRRLEATHEVTDFEPHTLYAWRAVGGPYRGAEHFQLEQRNGGTRIAITLAVEDLHFLARLAEPLIVRSGRRNQEHSLETLRDLLETHGSDHPR
jgi:uncharacterized protein YndB with AHSA1/START domain